jgi:hypothetical protein
MKPSTYQAVEDAAAAAAELTVNLLRKGEATKEQLALAKMGAGMVSALAKFYQTNSARESTAVRVLMKLSPDPDEFKRLVAVSLPDSAIGKALNPALIDPT